MQGIILEQYRHLTTLVTYFVLNSIFFLYLVTGSYSLIFYFLIKLLCLELETGQKKSKAEIDKSFVTFVEYKVT